GSGTGVETRWTARSLPSRNSFFLRSDHAIRLRSSAVPVSTPTEITCLIVDDHEVVREGLRLSLSRAPHIRVTGEASDAATAVALAERRRPDVAIMDVRMPGMDGREATKEL